MGTEYILELKHISKSFPGVKALDDVTLCVRLEQCILLWEKMVQVNPH